MSTESNRNEKFNDKDAFAQRGWARRTLYVFYSFIIAIWMAHACAPDNVDACKMICYSQNEIMIQAPIEDKVCVCSAIKAPVDQIRRP